MFDIIYITNISSPLTTYIIKGAETVEDIEYIKNLDIIRNNIKNKTEKEIEQLINSVADEEFKIIKNKSS